MSTRPCCEEAVAFRQEGDGRFNLEAEAYDKNAGDRQGGIATEQPAKVPNTSTNGIVSDKNNEIAILFPIKREARLALAIGAGGDVHRTTGRSSIGRELAGKTPPTLNMRRGTDG